MPTKTDEASPAAAAFGRIDQQIYGRSPEHHMLPQYNGLELPLSAGQALQAVVGSSERPADFRKQQLLRDPTASSGVDLQQIMRDLSGSNDPEVEDHVRAISGTSIATSGFLEDQVILVEAPSPAIPYFTTIPQPAIDEQTRGRKPIDSSVLRDIRKRLEVGAMQPGDHDVVAQDLMGDVVWLSSDYIGNSDFLYNQELEQLLISSVVAIIQKLFEQCSSGIKMAMLERIAPYLAAIGCHKNGTWAAQK